MSGGEQASLNQPPPPPVASASATDRVRYLGNSFTRAIPRLKTRTKIWLQYIGWISLVLIAIGCVYLLLSAEDLGSHSFSSAVSSQVEDINSNLGRRYLGRSNQFKLHGDLSSIPKPANWTHIDYAARLKYPLDRPPMDSRIHSCKNIDYNVSSLPKATVIFIFCNEPFETLLRSVHSVLNTSPPDLLEEIILVDDGSEVEYIRENGSGLLEDYIRLLPKVRLIRQGGRTGIVQARMRGIMETKSEVFVILDSHIECQPGWLEPLLYPIGQDRTVVTMPHIDGINKSTYELTQGGVGCTLGLIWNMMEHAIKIDKEAQTAQNPVAQSLSFMPERHTTTDSPHHHYRQSPLRNYKGLNPVPDSIMSPPDRLSFTGSEYVSSPAMAGGLFAAHRDRFLEIGGYDELMIGWGAENVEFSLRLWQCGGKLLCTECSRVNHMFGGGKFYRTEHNSATVNRMRTISSWLRGPFADLSWHVLGRPSFEEIGDITNVEQIQKKLKCQNFKWFLDNVYPESYVRSVPQDVPYLGPLVNLSTKKCLRNSYKGSSGISLTECLSNSSGPIERQIGSFTQIFWRRPGYITVENSDETCLVAHGKGVRWDWCSTVWLVEELAVFDSAHAKIQKLSNQAAASEAGSRGGAEEEETAQAAAAAIAAFEKVKDELYTEAPAEISKMFSYFGNMVLLKIRDQSSGQCLSTDPDTDAVILQDCRKADSIEQLWLWTNYKMHDFWVNHP